MKHKIKIELTERQANLILSMIDSYESGRAIGGFGASDTDIKSQPYQAVDRAAKLLEDKIHAEQTRIERSKATDRKLKEMLQRVRGSL